MTLKEIYQNQHKLRDIIRKYMYDLTNAAPSRESWVPGENLEDDSLCVIVYTKRYGFLKRKRYELYLEIYENFETGFYFDDGKEPPVISVLKPKDLFEYLDLVKNFFVNAKGDRSNLNFPRETPKVPDLSSFVMENQDGQGS